MLYVYSDNEKRKKLREKFNNYIFMSIVALFSSGDSIQDVSDYIYDNRLDYVFLDITNIIRDGIFYKSFIERLLYLVKDNIDNVHFCIRENYLDNLIDWCPYSFWESELNYEFSDYDSDDDAYDDIHIDQYNIPINIYFYNSIEIHEIKYNNKIISVSTLFESYNGLILQYNIKEIKQKLSGFVDFIDLSSLLRMIDLRKDLILQIEIFLMKLTSFYKGKFCINKDLIEDLIEKLPYLFNNVLELEDDTDNYKKEETVDNNIPNIDEISQLIDEFNDTLKGHDIFKLELRHNILKYAYLNKMNERKILSIIICGQSGIGKTETAKILSEKMYPGEDLIKINFGNYSTEGVLNSLIGSPLGYVGSEEGGELINKIEKTKSKVILIDEFEKATPSVYNFFYELLEDGIFTDRHGRKHDLNGYIIVFTSNMTQEQYRRHIPDSLKSRFDLVYYFVSIPEEEKRKFIYSCAKDLIMKLKEQFGKDVCYENIVDKLTELTIYNNLRDIKRKVEDIVFEELFSGEYIIDK